jgi:hypothetical protein
MEDLKNKIKVQITKLQKDFENILDANLADFLNRLNLFNRQTIRQEKVFKITDRKVLIGIAKNHFAKFPNKKIAIVGDTRMNIRAVDKIFKEFGIGSQNYEFFNEYLNSGHIGSKLQNFYNSEIYAGILMGPIAHSVKGKSGTNVQHQTAVPIIKVGIGAKRPKITNESLRIAIVQLLNNIN